MLRERLSGNQLKLIAVVTMVMDHIGYSIQLQALRVTHGGSWPDSLDVLGVLLRAVGRVAFPIFAFLLVEGFLHTSDRRRYMMRMGVFALVAEVPFDLLIAGKIWFPQAQNVFLTFFLGLCMLYAIDRISRKSSGGGWCMILILVLIASFLSWGLRADYGYTGIVLIAMFYQYRWNRKTLCILGFLWMICSVATVISWGGLLVSFVLIYLYNGQQGKRKFGYLFYWFYPVHMLVLAGIFMSI